MKAENHFQKALRFETTQSGLQPATDWESIVEICYLAAHHFLIAGVDWRGGTHPSTHAHNANPGLLRAVGAPEEVFDTWRKFDNLRSGNVYGGRTDGAASAQARDAMGIIKAWAESVRPG